MPAPPRPSLVARRPVRLVSLVAAVLLGGLVTAAPAAAHDRLVGSEPGDAAVLEQAPASVVLTFSAEQLPVGAAVVVSDASGADHADGAPVVEGETVTQPLRADLPAGAYTVRWRSVSGDGHPIEGSFVFEVTGDAASERDVADPAPADPTPTPGPADADDADGAGAPVTDDGAASGAAGGTTPDGQVPGDDGGTAPVLAGVGLAAAAAAATTVVVLRRRRGAGEGTAP